MQLSPKTREWLLNVNRPDPYGLEKARAEELVRKLEADKLEPPKLPADEKA